MRKFYIFFIVLFLFPLLAFSQNAIVIKSPNKLPQDDPRAKVFLGGSIDMGKSEDWQAKLEKELSDQDIIILNPRRENWNKDWKPISSDSNFRKQVEWELEALEASDVIIIYFASGSQSPISLLEYGLYARTNKLLIVCPEGFWRKGNVDIVAEKYNIDVFETLEEMTVELKKRL